MTVLDDIRHAKNSLREAMLTVECWPEAMSAVASACGARCGQLIGMDESGKILTHVLTGVPQEDFDQLLAFGLGDPIRNPRLMIGRRADLLAPAADQDWVDEDARKKSQIYQEFYHRLDLTFNCQTVLVREPSLLLRASVTKSTRQGPLSAEDMRVFTALSPHIQAAARVQFSLAQAVNLSSMRMLEAMDAPGLLLDAGGGVIAVSAAAEAEVSKGRLLRLRHRRLDTLLAEDSEALQRAIDIALSDPESDLSGANRVRLRNREGRYVYVLEVIPLGNSGHLPGLTAAVLILVRPASALQSPAELARNAWGLTAAEAEIAASLAAGEDLNAIGDARGVSRTTVRSQLHSIYAKADVHRQAELVSAVLSLGKAAESDPA